MALFIVFSLIVALGMVESIAHRSDRSKGEITCIRNRGLYLVSTSDGMHCEIHTSMRDAEAYIARLKAEGYVETPDE